MKTNNSNADVRFSASKAKSVKEVPLSPEKMDILDNIDRIVNISKKNGIDKYLSKGDVYVDYVAGKLKITPLQAILFSHFLEKSDDPRINISEIAESLKCSKVKIIKYLNECEELEKRKFIRCNRSDDTITFRVPQDVKDSLRKYNEYIPKSRENLSIAQFFFTLNELFGERSEDELNFGNLTGELLDLINMNMHLEFCKKIMSYKLGEDDVTLLARFCDLSGNDNDDNIGFHDFLYLYDAGRMSANIKWQFSRGNHNLIRSKYIENTNSGGFVNSECWKLSDMAKKELLSELGVKGKRNYEKDLIRYDSIKHKKMFFNARESEEIQTLISLLSEENYHKIEERLEEKGMRKGFACLFSGGPGTGKTETVYQIARETKRHIMKIDVSGIKSSWYGESEKNLKKLFDTYRNAVDDSEIAPILLFNEADAIIGKRKEFTASSRAVDQVENTIQNIILEEMENLSGILIATTNLTQNMDKAFERRFLYKINFGKPEIESRKRIWKSLIEELPDDTAVELSARFELSGGQIENIARKVNVDTILKGLDLSLCTLAKYCEDESQNNFTPSKRIGFNA